MADHPSPRRTYIDEEAYADNSKNHHTAGKTTSMTVNDGYIYE
jgi:hypothetical protein